VSPLGVGCDLLEKCVAGGTILGIGGKKGPERLMGDEKQYHEGMLGEGQGWGAVGRDPCWPRRRTGHGFRLTGSRGQWQYGRSIEGRCREEGEAFVLQWREWRCWLA